MCSPVLCSLQEESRLPESRLYQRLRLKSGRELGRLRQLRDMRETGLAGCLASRAPPNLCKRSG